MKKRAITVGCSVLALGLGVAVLAYALRHGEVHPVDEATAREEFMRFLARQGLSEQQKHVEPIPTRGTWLQGQWVFAVRNPSYKLVGGLVYDSMFLVGPNLGRRDPATQSSFVTREVEGAFQWQINHKPPQTGEEALEIAKAFIWLSTRTHPERLEVLRRGEVPTDLLEELGRHYPNHVQSIAEQIVDPRISKNHVAPQGDTVFTVELCSRSKDYWGNVYFWHLEIGKGIFSVSQRPIFRPVRGYA